MTGKKKKRSTTMRQLVLAARAGRTALSARLASLDIYPGQDALLLALSEADGLSLRELATRLSVRPPTITKTIARLAAQGLVDKRASDQDARQSHAFLTERGEQIVDEVRLAQRDVERLGLKGLSTKEIKLLRKLLQRVERNLEPAASGTAEEDED
ncbi:MarR family winged helix-turn-helix transcriptional regulator [Consotaella aegiceratis]|uniref:MarR family winged helix-turn-helix transcriptional regulator n=1 Tax=Consotaella aegiceratis TaxID=3097961 RepID=UPI002F3F88A8